METGLTADKEAAAHCLAAAAYLMDLPKDDPDTLSGLTLAFVGDAVFEIIIRTWVLRHGNAPVHKLHKKASAYVSAVRQAEAMQILLPLLTEKEESVYRRGRNARSYTKARHASTIEYRVSTGFEALIGYLYLTGAWDRLMVLVQTVTDWRENGEGKKQD